MDIIVVFLFFRLIGAGRDGVAVQQDLVTREIGLELADLMIDIENVVLILEARLLETRVAAPRPGAEEQGSTE